MCTDRTLELLAKDIEEMPECLQPITSDLLSRIQMLVGDVQVDLEVPLVEMNNMEMIRSQ